MIVAKLNKAKEVSGRAKIAYYLQLQSLNYVLTWVLQNIFNDQRNFFNKVLLVARYLPWTYLC